MQPKVLFQTINYSHTLHWELRGPSKPDHGFDGSFSPEQASAASLLLGITRLTRGGKVTLLCVVKSYNKARSRGLTKHTGVPHNPKKQ